MSKRQSSDNEPNPFVPYDSEFHLNAVSTLFSCSQFKVLGIKEQHRQFNGLVCDPIEWFMLYREHGAVAVLIHNVETDEILLVEQIRPATLMGKGFLGGEPRGVFILEIVAGAMDDQESAEDSARREALEEGGVKLRLCIREESIFLGPGGSNEAIHLFYAPVVNSDLVAEGGGLESENEDLRLHWVSLAEALDLINQGRIIDAKTIIAIQKLYIKKLKS